MNHRRDFVVRNIEYFKERLEDATNERIPMTTAGGTVKDTFQELIEDSDHSLLPYCLYVIYLGLGVSQDKKFSMSAFEEMTSTLVTYNDDSTLSYFYARLLHLEEHSEKSEEIIISLSNRNFPPAIATRGDLAWVNHQYKISRDFYRKASIEGHFYAKTTLLRLFGKKTNVASRSKVFFGMLKDNFTKKITEEKYLYLNFYGLNRKQRIILE